MKRLAYISTIDMNSDVYMGVAKKIRMQCEAFQKIGFQVENLSNDTNDIKEKIRKLFPSYYATAYKKIKNKINTYDDLDVCYIRYSCASRGLIDVLKTIRQKFPTCRIILEIPTYPYKQEMTALKAKPQYFRDVLYRGQLKKYIDQITTFSPNSEIYGIPVTEITNGVDIDIIKQRKPKSYNPNEIVILGVAGMQIWHGFDRIIEGLSQYYKSNDAKPGITFIAAGEGPYKEKWIQLANKYGISEHVKFVGVKTGSELEELYNEADIGVGSLGLHLVMDYPHVSILKTREYCAKGLPFLTTDKDYLFNNKDFNYSMIVNDDDSPIEMKEIVEFLSRFNNEAPVDVLKNMRQYAMEHIQWSEILRPIVERAQKQ